MIEQSCAATRILVDDTRVTGVETTHGTIETERVILTAGVWSSELFDLPVERERRFMFFTEDAPSFPRELPLTIDFGTGFYFHREGAALALGGREQTSRSSRRSPRGGCRPSPSSASARAGGGGTR